MSLRPKDWERAKRFKRPECVERGCGETWQCLPCLKQDAENLTKALTELLDFVVSGRRYVSRNPYTIPEVKQAQEALLQKE